MRVILAIELPWSKGFRPIWLECDFSLLCQAFSSFTSWLPRFENKLDFEWYDVSSAVLN